MKYRTTIARQVSCKGTGVHSGMPCKLIFKPATFGSGIRYFCPEEIPALYNYISRTAFATQLMGKNGSALTMVEHMLSACYGLGITDLIIEVDSQEAPIFDGSALTYCALLQSAGLNVSDEENECIIVQKPIVIEEEGRSLRILPGPPSFYAEVMLTPECKERFEFSPLDDDFCQEIAPARTFAQLSEIQTMQKAGYVKGASLDAGIALHEGNPINVGGFRMAQECARHKILDMMGDFSLLGGMLYGRVEGLCSGHGLNHKAMVSLMNTPKAFVRRPLSFLTFYGVSNTIPDLTPIVLD